MNRHRGDPQLHFSGGGGRLSGLIGHPARIGTGEPKIPIEAKESLATFLSQATNVGKENSHCFSVAPALFLISAERELFGEQK